MCKGKTSKEIQDLFEICEELDDMTDHTSQRKH